MISCPLFGSGSQPEGLKQVHSVQIELHRLIACLLANRQFFASLIAGAVKDEGLSQLHAEDSGNGILRFSVGRSAIQVAILFQWCYYGIR